MPYQPKEEKFRPLKNLGRLLESKNIQLKKAPLPRQAPLPQPPLSPIQEAQIFNEAMADVTPLTFDCHWQIPKHQLSFEDVRSDEEQQAVEALHRLMENGQGFTVADTDEYMESTGPGTHTLIARQLHQGRFSVQDHIDLHGLNTHEADVQMHAFVRKAIYEGKRAVLIVHGRGLTSPRKPVLKNKVYHWLTRGPLRKHVIAFTSARSCDGGAGATYVLLRNKPLTKRLRKRTT